jgi:hypothetical protein
MKSCLRTLVYYYIVHCVASANTCVLLRCSLRRICEQLFITTLFITSYLRTLVYYYVVHCVVSANTCVLVRCSLCRICEHLCISTLFIMSCLRTLVYYYVVHYVVFDTSVRRHDIMNNVVIHKCSQIRHNEQRSNTQVFADTT